MWQTVSVCIICCCIGSIVCPPLKPEKVKKSGPPRSDEMNLGLQYERYLKEIVSALEEDEGFRKKLEETNVTDIKSGDIAKHLEFVGHNVRTKLDELKRREVERLTQVKKLLDHRELLMKNPEAARRLSPMGQGLPNMSAKVVEAMLKAQGIEEHHDKASEHHVDLSNPDTFEVEDLKKLIVQATGDLEKMDKVRKDEFKRYEMSKEHLRREKLKQMSERERKEEEARYEEMKKKHKEHPKVNHPGSKDQLEEVWEESDGMDKEDFDPKTFFFMHDTNGDKHWDEVEVESLFQKELDKVYDPDAPEDDMMERYEEMNRMREHVYGEVDKNQDGLISLDEFLQSTRDKDWDNEEPWGGLEDEEIYSDDELRDFEHQYDDDDDDLHAQPGEVNIPPVQPSEVPKVMDNNELHFQGQVPHDNLQGQGQPVPVQHMEQQGQGQPIVQEHIQQQPVHQAQPQAAQQQQQQPVQAQAQPAAHQQQAQQPQQAQPVVQDHQQAQQNQDRSHTNIPPAQ